MKANIKTLKMNEPISIICQDHGTFWLTPNDHIGENEEKIAYGCPKCDHYKNH